MSLSIQEKYYPEIGCFGCGQANPRGLRLKSYAGEDGVFTADFTPWPEHDNGLGYLNGGIISTVLDCHSGAVMVHTAVDNGWTTEGLALPYVTAGLDVRFRRPAPLTEAVSLAGEVLAADESQMRIAVRLEWDGKVRAEAEALWKRWRPR